MLQFRCRFRHLGLCEFSLFGLSVGSSLLHRSLHSSSSCTGECALYILWIFCWCFYSVFLGHLYLLTVFYLRFSSFVFRITSTTIFRSTLGSRKYSRDTFDTYLNFMFFIPGGQRSSSSQPFWRCVGCLSIASSAMPSFLGYDLRLSVGARMTLWLLPTLPPGRQRTHGSPFSSMHATDIIRACLSAR